MPDFKLYQSYLFEADNFKSKRLLTVIFAVYMVLLMFVVAHHEPWMDEAQGWLLVKDASLTEIFTKYLRYEGSPGLWHLILAIPAKLGFPYFTINIISAAFSALAVWIFLRCSLFPLVIKILFPFSYFIFFQYAVVARSYCLIAPLLFLIAIKFKTRIEKPIAFSFLLCLLANVSAHTFLIAGGLFTIHLLGIVKLWKELDKPTKLKNINAILLFGLNAVLIVLLLAPPSDHFLDSGNNYNLLNFFNSSKWAISGALMLDESSRFGLLQIWLSLAVFFITIIWVRHKKLASWYLFPLFLLLTLFAVKYRNLWHDGITFLFWIFILWIGFDKEKAETAEKHFLSKIVLVSFSIVLAVQVYWSMNIVRYNFQHSYSASYELAKFIKENNLEDQKIFISGWKTVAVHPYFDKNIFYNYNAGSNKRFWIWSNTNQTPLGVTPEVIGSIQNDQPDAVIFASDHLDLNAIKELKGYYLERVFPGYLFWKTGIHEWNSYWLFRKGERETNSLE